MADNLITLDRHLTLRAETRAAGETTEVSLELEGSDEPCTLHWGVGREGRNWQRPLRGWPAGSHESQGVVETPFPHDRKPRRLTLTLHPAQGERSLDFVLFFPASHRWDNNHGRDYHLAVFSGAPQQASVSNAAIDEIAGVIVERETGNHSWTLMHRFNLCHDLLDRVGPGSAEGLALLFVWLRFSAIRQLDWQRNYNTKPAELAHAQDRLTSKLAGFYVRARETDVRADGTPRGRPAGGPGASVWLRLMLTTVGRGGEGQRVRDEVLNIMHRRGIKEVSGHFMEEWHQKLHNNTTPDDVVICEAYLAFLRSQGDRGVFYRTLEGGGVTKGRLESYERPIKSDPDFIPHLKDPLIHDFEEFLRVLNRLHAGTDLDAAIEGAGPLLDAHLGGLVDWVRHHRHEGAAPLDTLVARATDARKAAVARLDSLREAWQVRALLYLDLALEELVRLAIERHLHHPLALEHMALLIGLAFENVRLSVIDAELGLCGAEWDRVRTASRDDPLWPLRADAALDRTGRAVAALLDGYQRTLQPLAERLGGAFHAASWTIAAFSEEVMRGRPVVVLPVLARLLRQTVREKGRLPPWHLVSTGRGFGRLRLVDSLAAVQGSDMSESTVLLAGDVGGQEEIPAGVTAVITPRDLDVLSHLAIRARNAGVLLASCHAADQIQRLRALEGRPLTLTIGASGDVVVQEGMAGDVRPSRKPGAERPQRGHPAPARFIAYAVTQDRFDDLTVGRKALGLVRLEGKLPRWMRLPRSLAVPFGAIEETLNDGRNAEVAHRYAEARRQLRQVAAGDAEVRRQRLDDLRQMVRSLAMPANFADALRRSMDATGLTWPGAERAWQKVKAVWASTWNERACLSREASGIGDDEFDMSVLIQQVVEADYAFVIHTTNPFTGERDELYAEVVLGLGETLVGNFPGRALGFTFTKAHGGMRVRTLPSKSVGLYGAGLIFRSDSNAEDLAGYAGAGLYDSVMLDAPRERLLEYAGEPIVWDNDFRRDFVNKVAQIGIAAEQAAGVPQDVEGACTNGQWYVLQSRPQVGAPDA